MNIRECFSSEELNMMNYWVSHYGYGPDSREGARRDFAEILSEEYATAKENLYTLFGNKFILSKEVEFSTPITKLEDNLRTALNGDIFYNSIWNKYNDTYWRNEEHRIWSSTVNLINYTTLAANIYYGADFQFVSPKTNKTIKIDSGCKVMKALRKIADAYDIPGFEDFRLKCSQALNCKSLKGTLCLSIHPMDYMTMSDNDCSWTSCMSWQDRGCYRVGTVEMMNSPMVVVAYLKSEEDMNIRDYTWNSKKWRTLIVLTGDAIVSIKGYPYQHDGLAGMAMSWLAELSNENWESHYDLAEAPKRVDIRGDYLADSITHETIYNHWFKTNYMYNDFGCTHHWILLDSVSNKELPRAITYSGRTQCVWCGETHYPEGVEENLVCSDCGGRSEYVYCPNCDTELCDEDEIIWVGDYGYCECCVENYNFLDPTSGEWCPDCDGMPLFLCWDKPAKDVDINDYDSIVVDSYRHAYWRKDERINHAVDDLGNEYIRLCDSDKEYIRRLFSYSTAAMVRETERIQKLENIK